MIYHVVWGSKALGPATVPVEATTVERVYQNLSWLIGQPIFDEDDNIIGTVEYLYVANEQGAVVPASPLPLAA